MNEDHRFTPEPGRGSHQRSSATAPSNAGRVPRRMSGRTAANMKPSAFVIIVTAAAVLGLVGVWATPVAAGGHHGGREFHGGPGPGVPGGPGGHFGHGHGFFGTDVSRRGPFWGNCCWGGPFIPFGVIASPVVVNVPPPVVYGPSAYDDWRVYDDPPAVYDPPAGGTVSVAPPPPAPPTVVQYATGRYELRGDGATTPYTWVWIPNPPPPPPAEAPAAGEASPARHTELYRWTDEQRVVHWTDRWDTVPQQYRKQAKQTPQS
jgi:hypothetical protein